MTVLPLPRRPILSVTIGTSNVRLHGTCHPCCLCLQAVQLVKEVTFQQVALGLLYHISQDDRHKSMFIYTDAVTVILDLLMRVDDLTTTPELIALAVNLTQNERIAQVWRIVLSFRVFSNVSIRCTISRAMRWTLSSDMHIQHGVTTMLVFSVSTTYGFHRRLGACNNSLCLPGKFVSAPC